MDIAALRAEQIAMAEKVIKQDSFTFNQPVLVARRRR